MSHKGEVVIRVLLPDEWEVEAVFDLVNAWAEHHIPALVYDIEARPGWQEERA